MYLYPIIYETYACRILSEKIVQVNYYYDQNISTYLPNDVPTTYIYRRYRNTTKILYFALTKINNSMFY